jgi:hypothetical protein
LCVSLELGFGRFKSRRKEIEMNDDTLPATAIRELFLLIIEIQRHVRMHADQLTRERPKDLGQLLKNLSGALEMALACEQRERLQHPNASCAEPPPQKSVAMELAEEMERWKQGVVSRPKH